MEPTKTQNQITLENISAQLDAFGATITNNSDYEKYKVLIDQEADLMRKVAIEKMTAMVKSADILKEGETPVVAMPEIQFQNRTVRVEISFPIPKKIPQINPTIKN